jgi:hypothetical protein
MRVLAALAVLAAFIGLAIAAYAVYEWQWNDADDVAAAVSDDAAAVSDEQLAELAAGDLATGFGGTGEAVEEVAPSVWNVRAADICFRVYLRKYLPTLRIDDLTNSFAGVVFLSSC